MPNESTLVTPKPIPQPGTEAGDPVVKPIAAQPPAHRRLQVFSLDPRVDAQLESSLISRSVLPVAWEDVTEGPVGEYLEVVDVDPASQCVYDPIDLNRPDLLAQDGLPPSAGNPQFHQQMVYAVAMKTISNFERVLGRRVLWAERRRDENDRPIDDPKQRFVQRLRIYPHAFRDENAYYSPAKVALLFGYFNASSVDPRDELPGGVVFTCLSHDVVAHETTHAILDGMHRRMLDATNVDMVAFHEAFADIVAIFQHFTLPGLLLDQIQRSRGNLRSNGYLAQLAGQFARATGQGDALRNALGRFDKDDRREPPDPTALARTVEPHERGAILVAAVFDAFVRMYEDRVADLRRIATGGTGVLPEGDIHPDLARRFAEEAVRLSQRVVNMAIRAVDYLPPVDVTFGDFLRAIVTADADFYPDDPRRYRLAFIEAFRDRGIYPLDVRALAEDALRWRRVDGEERRLIGQVLPPPAVLRTMATAYDSAEMARRFASSGGKRNDRDLRAGLARGEFDAAAQHFIDRAWRAAPGDPGMTTKSERYHRYLMEREFAIFLHDWIVGRAGANVLSPDESERLGWNLGLDLKSLANRGGAESPLEVHAIRPTVRLHADGRSKLELLIVLTQRATLSLGDGNPVETPPGDQAPSFVFRGGTTLIVDPEAGVVTYSVAKNILSQARKQRQMAFLHDEASRLGTAAIIRRGLTERARTLQRQLEPFALAHTRSDERGTY